MHHAQPAKTNQIAAHLVTRIQLKDSFWRVTVPNLVLMVSSMWVAFVKNVILPAKHVKTMHLHANLVKGEKVNTTFSVTFAIAIVHLSMEISGFSASH